MNAPIISDRQKTLETFLTTGNMGLLKQDQQAFIIAKTCEQYGLQPIMRPFEILSFQGIQRLYFTKNGCDQIANVKKLTRKIVHESYDNDRDVMKVIAEVTDGERTEMGIAFLSMSRFAIDAVSKKPERKRLEGDDYCNAMMKVYSKAMRRATLAFVGIPNYEDYNDESVAIPAALTVEKDAPLLISRIEKATSSEKDVSIKTEKVAAAVEEEKEEKEEKEIAPEVEEKKVKAKAKVKVAPAVKKTEKVEPKVEPKVVAEVETEKPKMASKIKEVAAEVIEKDDSQEKRVLKIDIKERDSLMFLAECFTAINPAWKETKETKDQAMKLFIRAEGMPRDNEYLTNYFKECLLAVQ